MTIEAIHNVSITVADVEKSSKWYQDYLGFKVQSDSERTPEFSQAVTGVPGAHLRVVHMDGHGLHFELMQYLGGQGSVIEPGPNNVGGLQVGFKVDDAQALYADWKAKGVKMCSPEPAEVPSGPLKGGFIFFCQDPDGVVLKFMQPPKS